MSGIRSDNRWENLREGSQAENMQNLGISKFNKSGYPGVYRNEQNNNWVSRASVNGKTKHISSSKDPKVCAKAYIDFVNNNRPFNTHELSEGGVSCRV